MLCQPSHLRLVTGIDTMQANFAQSLLWQAEDLPADVCGPAGSEPIKRFNVYRNNIFASLTATLSARFPVISRLVGDRFFAAMARTFIGLHPPRSPVLLAYGADMPAFLETFAPVRDLPYLADVARLELAVAAAYHAADGDPVTAVGFAALSPQGMLDARPMLHPSASLLKSRYPVISIWETNTHDKTVRAIGADIGGESALIVRQGFDVTVVRLDAAAYAFLASLAEGDRVEEAVERALRVSVDFDLTGTLSAVLRSGAISRADRTEFSNVIPLQQA
jgi:hypothetical protein